MRVWTVSDLHLRHHDVLQAKTPADRATLWRHPIPDANVCVVAGDVCEGAAAAIHWLADVLLPHMPVVYVLGNHEFYNDHVEGCREEAREVADKRGVHLLDDSVVEIDGQRFVGGTLWTDYGLFGTPAKSVSYARQGLNDHVYIAVTADHRIKFQPEDALRLHRRTRRFLERNIREGDVVVTHHCPHPNSVADEFRGDPVTPAFCSDLSQVIEATRPALWIHGHTHTSFDYDVGGTRIVCNPHGYGNENARGFEPGLVVDLEEGFTCKP